MAQKTVGFVELEWVCPNCGNRNPGPAQKCGTCGTPQPDEVEFVQPVQETLLEDEARIAAAQAGPDVHCPYCEARNPASAKNCRNCGAPLDDAAARAAGAVLGAHRATPAADAIACPNCGTLNAPQQRRCKKCGAGLVPGPELEERSRQARRSAQKKGGSLGRVLLFGLLGFGALLALFIFLSNRTSAALGTVEDVNWRRTVVIEELVPVAQENWLTEIPAGTEVGQCRSKVLRTQDEPAPSSVEVCGTPYTVDTGTGFGQVVQDCQYQIYADWCEFTVEEWRQVDSAVATGQGLDAAWPALDFADSQRAGERAEEYIITFSSDGETFRFVTKDPAEAARFQPGSRWNLSVNTFGALTDVEPAR